MAEKQKRRRFLGAAGAAIIAGGAAERALAQAPGRKGIKIVGISCSPRKGKTTAAAVNICLEAARQVAPNVETELIDLAGMSIPGSVAAGVPLEPGRKDDFPQLVPKLADANVAGIIVGSPVYFANMSALCKAFLDRCIAFRKKGFALSNKAAGAVAVGGARNGGQELTVRSIQTALMCQEMIVVAKNLGRRVAEVALLVARARD